jgi:hypothetical protein
LTSHAAINIGDRNVTAAKMIANKNNAQHSTGPQDTARTRFNGVQHGLTSRQTVIPAKARKNTTNSKPISAPTSTRNPPSKPPLPSASLPPLGDSSASNAWSRLSTTIASTPSSTTTPEPIPTAPGQPLHRPARDRQNAPFPPLPVHRPARVRQSHGRIHQTPGGTRRGTV